MSEHRRENPSSSGFTVADVYFVLFRHKWKIIFCFLSGIITATLMYALHTPLYRSDAKLLIRYVVETKQVGPVREDQAVRSPDGGRGANIINSEIEVLSSLDLAVQVVGVIGTDRLLAKAGGGTNINKAVLFIRRHLTVNNPLRNNVISVLFDHPDPQVAQEVLTALITAYLEKHIEIHKAIGTYEILQRQTDQLRSRLMETEKELNDVKRQAGIISLEDAKKEQSFLLDTFRKGLLEIEQELVARKTKVAQMEKWLEATAAAATNANAAPAVIASVLPQPTGGTNEFIGLIRQRLQGWYLRKIELLGQFKEDSQTVQQVNKHIAQMEKMIQDYEASRPATPTWTTNAAAAPAAIAGFRPQDLLDEKNMVASLESRHKLVTQQLEKVKNDAVTLDKVESRLAELTRKRDMEEANFRYFYQSLEQARIDNSIESGKSSNIAQVQAPSFGVRDFTGVIRMMAMALAAGIFGGFGLAFLIEFFLDQSVRRPVDIETKVKAPLFLTIPKYTVNGAARRRRRQKKAQPQPQPDGDTPPGQLAPIDSLREDVNEIAPWEPGHQLHAYYESLRDRLMTFFEVRGMNHKPKLVAVTNCSSGAGSTSIAAGLAASLSETGDGNVLLVDLNSGQGAAHPFYRGKPCALPDILDAENREAAMVQEHLYWVAGNEPSDRLPRILPKRLMHLVPKLKASDYDYIIFDMPSINETSSVPRLAALMDMVFLVAESDKTNAETMKRAVSLLQESKTNIGVVLNKYQKRVPDSLQQDL